MIKQIHIYKMDKKTYEDLTKGITQDNLWDYPMDELDYIFNEFEEDSKFAFINNRLWEIPQELEVL